MHQIYRQGDVALIRSTIPPHVTPAERVAGERVVIALGEATGHAHAIADLGVRVYEHEGTRWIRVPKLGATLAHEEHGPIALAEGDYEVRIQREYLPGSVRNVTD